MSLDMGTQDGPFRLFKEYEGQPLDVLSMNLKNKQQAQIRGNQGNSLIQ